MKNADPMAIHLTVVLITLSVAPLTQAENTSDQAFRIVSETSLNADPGALLMTCPAHKYGGTEGALKKLNDLVSNRSPDVPSTIWICRSDQIETLQTFAPVVDWVAINPFVHLSDKTPQPADSIWPGIDHGALNQIRQIRTTAGQNKRLLACINLDGEPIHFRKRRASFEEIQWMVAAVIGGNFQGIVWRGSPNDTPWQERLRRLEQNLLNHAPELGKAQPVNWVQSAVGQPVSALATETTLFVCLLNPDYMGVMSDRRSYQLPLSPSRPVLQITLTPPIDVHVVSGSSISGTPLSVERQREAITVSHRLLGSGDILVFELTGETAFHGSTGTNSDEGIYTSPKVAVSRDARSEQ